MTSYTPPIETGLSGDAYLSEQAEAFGGPSRLHTPGVYALKLSLPDRQEQVTDRWAESYDVAVPEWIWAAFNSAGVLYVGGATNIYERIREHLDTPNRSASICHVFPIHSIWDVWQFDDPDRAFERESGIALDIRNQFPTLYVHQA